MAAVFSAPPLALGRDDARLRELTRSSSAAAGEVRLARMALFGRRWRVPHGDRPGGWCPESHESLLWARTG